MQLLINSLYMASIYVLIGISFLVIYQTVRFFHFAHGAMFMLGAYFIYLFNFISQVPFIINIILSISIVSVLGLFKNIFIFKPLINRGSSSVILLIASLGVYVILQNLVSLFFGADTKSVYSAGVVNEGLVFLGMRLTSIQIIIIITGFILTFSTWSILKYSKIGKLSRTVSNNPKLSEYFGISKNKIYNFVFTYGSAIAAIAGILIALDTSMSPSMGFRPLMMGVIVMIIGGVGSIPGIVLGALLLSFSQNIAAWYLPSQWQDAVAFLILLLFLLFRPQGFFGKPLKKAEI